MGSKRLLRTIIVLLLASCALLVSGILYLSHDRVLIIEMKRENLRVQVEMVAAAIAASGIAGSDAIAPERVLPILARFMAPANARARVYARDGSLIVDTAHSGDRPRGEATNASMRFFSGLIWGSVAKHTEGADLRGTAYPEVRMALAGSLAPLLAVNESGEQILSMAAPIQYRRAVLGALQLSTLPGEIDDLLLEKMKLIIAMLASSLGLSATVGVIAYFVVGRIGPFGNSRLG